ncbi:metal ABC transporter substrate-binding protein [Cerasicoccus arenae]|uniref:Metal ABC transporter substrate-binding protein n=1 Tax=Cerasicoccus arenae TaxID=424488 RepID=A0A8J3DGZ8_9BACT|nr:metal ABC transporter substrate-binding protein [Cerasicoccus arenae]MBK1858197.1 zinc ABC transporter substrate-binding protein [Cerasicoccus arenae]GHC00902.1 metal ABC transporter substrate-binding protein [Cerasicoccus arenae]
MKWIITLAAFLAVAHLPARLTVAASNGIAADWVRQVGGNQVQVASFADSGADPHHFEPSPRQINELAKADLIVAFGEGLEPWLNEAIVASGTSARKLILTDGLDLLEPGEAFWVDRPLLYPDAANKPPCCKEDALVANEIWTSMIPQMPKSANDGHGHDHDHGYDPHVWLDPQMAVLMILSINNALNELDPIHAAYFDKRREKYLDEIITLDEWAEARLGEIPTRRRLLINYHDNLRYFGRRYGFFTPTSILGSVSTESPDPSARDFNRLLKLISRFGVPAVFVDSTANPRLAEQVVREAGLPTPFVLYTGNVTAADGRAPDYLSLMRGNVETIVTALR